MLDSGQLNSQLISIEQNKTCRLFKRISEEKLTPKQQLELYRYVDGQKGYKVVCGGVSCIFEFEAYRFIGGGLHEDDSKNGAGGGLVVTTGDNPGCHGDGIGGDGRERTGEFAADMENDCGTSHGSPDSGLFSPTIQNSNLTSDPARATSSMSNVNAATTETLPSDDVPYGTPPSEREDEEINSEPDQELPLSADTSSAASRIRLREKNVAPDHQICPSPGTRSQTTQGLCSNIQHRSDRTAAVWCSRIYVTKVNDFVYH